MTATAVGITAEQVAGYYRDGFMILRRVFTLGEVAQLDVEARALVERQELIDVDNIRCRWMNHAQTGECRFDCFDPVIDIGPVCRKVALDARLIEPLSAIYGERACLFKDKLIFKPPGAKGYGLHQDYISWKTFPRTFTTVVVAIDPTDGASGATEVFPGYHTRGCLTPEDGDYHELPAGTVDEGTGVLLDLAPGDVGIFSGFTPHRSGPNRSDRWRRQLYLSYNALGDGGEQHKRHYDEFHRWLHKKYAEYGKTAVYFR